MNPGSSRLSDLDALVLLSEHMVSKARSGEWDEVPELERQRHVCLVEALSGNVTDEEAHAVVERLRRILALNEELTALAAGVRDDSAARLREMQQGQRARAAYAEQTKP